MKKHLNLSLDEKTVQWLKVKAAEERVTVSELVERIIRERIDDGADYVPDPTVKWCIICGRRFAGYGARCPDCRTPPQPDEQERVRRHIEEIRSWLEEQTEKWRKRAQH